MKMKVYLFGITAAAFILAGCNNYQAPTSSQTDSNYQVFQEKKRLQDECIESARERAADWATKLHQAGALLKETPQGDLPAVESVNQMFERDKKECIARYPL